MSETDIGALPLIPAPAHEWNTLLTSLKLAQGITVDIMGNNHKTVISMDMALYERSLQLLDCNPRLCRTFVVQLGELHACMASIRVLEPM